MANYKYLISKREEILKTIKPMCDAFGITNYDYIVGADSYSETLKLDDTLINCSCDSIEAVINELIRYIVITRDIYLGAFDTQTKHYIKSHWRN